jgi:hypothetical protein
MVWDHSSIKKNLGRVSTPTLVVVVWYGMVPYHTMICSRVVLLSSMVWWYGRYGTIPYHTYPYHGVCSGLPDGDRLACDR